MAMVFPLQMKKVMKYIFMDIVYVCSKGLCYSWYKYDKVLKVLLLIFKYDSGGVKITSTSNRAKKRSVYVPKCLGKQAKILCTKLNN